MLSRLTGIANHIKAPALKDDLGRTLAERLIRARPKGGEDGGNGVVGTPGEVNQALMELGATYRSPAGSGVDDGDPLRKFYVSTRLGAAIGRLATKGADRKRVDGLVAERPSCSCKLCDDDGVSTAYYDILDRITADSSEGLKTSANDAHATAGHASLPIAPPKKSKREEVIAVAVVCLKSTTSDQRRWLMVKRPSTGLLAGQWEFPSVCCWNSAGAKSSEEGEEEWQEGNCHC